MELINDVITRDQIDNLLLERFVSVNEKNPILRNVGAISVADAEWVIKQYCFFPKKIISMLVAACYSLAEYKRGEIVEELMQNIREEMGEGHGEISGYALPHYTLLKQEVQGSFGFDLADSVPSQSTNVFVNAVTAIMESSDPAFVSGAVYALENSAVPELSLVRALVKSTLEKKGVEMSDTFKAFFDWHINDIEVEHRDRLFKVATHYLDSTEDWESFQKGFIAVMETMDNWWISLSKEVHMG